MHGNQAAQDVRIPREVTRRHGKGATKGYPKMSKITIESDGTNIYCNELKMLILTGITRPRLIEPTDFNGSIFLRIHSSEVPPTWPLLMRKSKTRRFPFGKIG